MADPDHDATPDGDFDGDFDDGYGALGVEQPEADTLDQRRAQSGPADPGPPPFGELTMEADEADVLDQHQVVPVDEREV
jgi:hypothetical protein